jgi:hypothetical protein
LAAADSTPRRSIFPEVLAMRTIVSSLLILAAAPWIALAQTGPAPPSAANLVRLHPGPWRMPAAVAMGVRFDPETGEATVVPGVKSTNAAMPATSQAEARARAARSVTRHADGSLHAVLGAAFRSYEVVTIGADGRLTEDCVSSEAQARARVEAGAPSQVHQ